jgi:2-iminobutanoate/2-iminopropanoate deaminase
MRSITTEHAPLPAGHYAQAVISNRLVFVSGQLPVDPAGDGHHPGSIEDQTKQALANLGAVLREAGSGPSFVLKTTVYVSDIALWNRVNHVYAEFFGTHRPARAIVPTRELHYGYQVEIDAIATLDPAVDA